MKRPPETPKLKRTAVAAALLALLATPALAQLRQTDREFDGLKGKVKTAAVEEAVLKEVEGETVEQPRVLSRAVSYDADGNWMQWKDYDDKGRLMRSLAFSFIGKDRVTLSEDVEPPPDALVFVGPPRRGPRRPDWRYSYKFTYVYGRDGKRLGQTWYFNDGRLYLREVYRYAPGRRVWTLYDERGRLNNRHEFKLNERGDEVEVLLHKTVADKHVYRYLEFDAQGNWTKRTMTRGFSEFDAGQFERLKPDSVEYRTITYH